MVYEPSKVNPQTPKPISPPTNFYGGLQPAKLAKEQMTRKNPTHVAHCQCGAVEVGAWGKPIIVNACYCDDCQNATQRFAESSNLGSTATAEGGTDFMVFRRDRIACTRGADRLQAMKLTHGTKTRRMITSCCATPMYLAFDDKRPWVSAYRASFGADAPPVEMRICTRFRKSDKKTADGLPSHLGYPLAMMVRILAAWPFMLFSRPVGNLP